MRTHTRLLLTALTAALVLAAAMNTASARRLQLSNTGIRAVWRAITVESRDFLGSEHEVICPLTLEGTLHSRTISKVSGQLIGYITRAIVGRPSCTFRSAEEFEIQTSSLPWHMRYDSFSGALPRIEVIRLQVVGLSYILTAIGTACLYKSSATQPFFGQAQLGASGESRGIRVDETRLIPLVEGGGLCPISDILKGTSEPITLLGTTTVITIRLVQ
jgi:hypothetical protein